MDKSSHVLGSKLLTKSLRESGGKAPENVGRHVIAFESYDPEDESSVMHRIEACRTSPVKAFIFAIISLTIVPLLAVKWSNRIYKFLLLTYTDIAYATKLIIHGPRTSLISS